MGSLQMTSVLRRLRESAARLDTATPSDGSLLQAFLTRRDEAAISDLVRRHGPMVFATCRRVLGCQHEAEDAFQATFLVLVRRAATIQPPEAVGAWLHGVATRIALKARASTGRRQARERQVDAVQHVEQSTHQVWRDLEPVLDQELQRLPGKYRDAIVLCDVQGKSRRDVAKSLGIPVGTLSGRLTTARRRLAEQLTRRGITLGIGAVATLLTTRALASSVPPPLQLATVAAMASLAAGGAVKSAKVLLLMRGELQQTMMTKVMLTIGFLVAMTLGGLALAQPLPTASSRLPGAGGVVEARQKRFPVWANAKAFVRKEDESRLHVRAELPVGRFLKLVDADGKMVHVHEFANVQPPAFLVELKDLRVHSVRGQARPVQEWVKTLKDDTLVFLHVADEEVKPDLIAEAFQIFRDDMDVLIMPTAVNDRIDKTQAFSPAKSLPQTFPGRLAAPGDPMPPKKN